jgi:hypothetical protein
MRYTHKAPCVTPKSTTLQGASSEKARRVTAGSKGLPFYFSCVLPVLAFIITVGTVASIVGCAALHPTAGTVNQDITQAIAGAGAAANTAEQEYTAGTITQTAANANAINVLGAAYNDARAAYLVYLNAVSLEAAACQPATTTAADGGVTAIPAPGATPAGTTSITPSGAGLTVNGQAVTCASATASATSANAAVQAKLVTLTGATATVQALK